MNDLWRSENDQRQQQRRSGGTARCKGINTKLANAPRMELADKAAWQQAVNANTDPHSRYIITFAERWARLMQAEVNTGRKLEDIASSALYEADTEGLTASMYGSALRTLVTSWEHGEQLRQWHNKRASSNNARGVVNPAIITVRKN